ncbi:MAG: hypothetical protein JWR14_7210 [Caballeronia sp.]|jgi:hypothetical protein|uniref:hypothetical protein n=1 Tax=Caballeronia sp. TaxID=1931223 RepID=UPI00261D7382|nr:hypothetical protein [Caballeronia sp.]MDB5837380.1 hypothetical protein [Caballeronia sp.]
MNTGNQSQSLNIRIRAAIQHAVRVIERDWFDVLVFSSAACHMGSCAGFTGDEELVQRYLGMRRHRTHSNES